MPDEQTSLPLDVEGVGNAVASLWSLSIGVCTAAHVGFPSAMVRNSFTRICSYQVRRLERCA